VNNYTIEKDGDPLEKHYWECFLRDEFPSYEGYWQKNVVELSHRPLNIQLKSDGDLTAIGKTPRDVCHAQLHYSMFRHLTKIYEIKRMISLDLNGLTYGMIHLVAASDIAFELLERVRNPMTYDPWIESAPRGSAIRGGQEARRSWQKATHYPLQDLRDYRNHLVHGRLMAFVRAGIDYFPRLTCEKKYVDWRIIVGGHFNPKDFDSGSQILQAAWGKSMAYFENQWQRVLLS